MYRVAPILTTVWQHRYWYGVHLKIKCKKTTDSTKQRFLHVWEGAVCRGSKSDILERLYAEMLVQTVVVVSHRLRNAT